MSTAPISPSPLLLATRSTLQEQGQQVTNNSAFTVPMVRCSICNNALARGRFEKTSSYYHERTTIHGIERSAVSCKYCQILLTTLAEGKVGHDKVISISEYGVSSWTRSKHGILVSINNPQGGSGFHVELVVSNLLGKSCWVLGLLHSSA